MSWLFQNRCHIPSFTIAKNHLPDALQGSFRRGRAIHDLDKMLRLPVPPSEPLLLLAALSPRPVPARTPRIREMLVNLYHQFLRWRSTLHHLISAIITDKTPKLLSLEKEEILVGVRERQENKTAEQNERKFFNNWPQPRMQRWKGPREKVMSVAQRKSGEESTEDGVELVEEGFTDTAMVFAFENWIWNDGVGECLVQFNVFCVVH